MDFNSDSIVTAKAKDIIPLTIIERIENLVDAWEFYYKKDGLDTKAELNIKAKLNSLYIKVKDQIGLHFQNKQDKADFIKVVDGKSVKEMQKATEILLKFLYTIGLTRLPMRKTYDETDLEQENEAFDL